MDSEQGLELARVGKRQGLTPMDAGDFQCTESIVKSNATLLTNRLLASALL